MIIEPLAGALGAEIRSLSLKTLEDAKSWEDIHRAFLKYSVLVFRDQELEPADLMRVGARFGEPCYYPFVTGIDGFPFIFEVVKEEHETVNFGGRITGVPSLLQTYNVFANMTILKSAGIKAPTIADPWTWTEFRAIAKRLTTSDRYGVCWGLRSPTAAIQTMAINYGGQYFYLRGGKWTFRHGAAEQNVVRQIHDMIHVDKSIDPAATGLSGGGVLPAFFGGKCAMTVQGNFQAQGMILQSPKGFNWAMFPLLKGTSQNQVANPQTFSIAQQSNNKRAAMQFIAYLLNARNMAKLAAGDWLIPANPEAGKIARRSTKHAGSWRVATASVVHFRKGNWVALTPYARWKAEVAQPSFVQYLAGRISMSELSGRLSDGWTRVRG